MTPERKLELLKNLSDLCNYLLAEHWDEGDLEELMFTLKQVHDESSAVFATAESCTGGSLSKYLTDISGSSAWFDGGVVTYSNEAKQSLLGVDLSSLEKYGAVSEVVAAQMAKGVLKQFPRATVGIAITGIAGPTGATKTKSVGNVCFGIATREPLDHVTFELNFSGERSRVRNSAAIFALILACSAAVGGLEKLKAVINGDLIC